jgi:hypothetical protein
MSNLDNPRVCAFIDEMKGFQPPQVMSKFREKIAKCGDIENTNLNLLLKEAQTESGLPSYWFKRPRTIDHFCNSE